MALVVLEMEQTWVAAEEAAGPLPEELSAVAVDQQQGPAEDEALVVEPLAAVVDLALVGCRQLVP